MRRPPEADAGAPSTAAAEIRAFTGDPDFMTSLARGLAVVQAFSERRRHLSIAELSRLTGIPRAAVRRCLHTLARLGYVSAGDGARFTLQPKVVGLGHAYLASTPLVVLAQPFLERVSDKVEESCSLATLDGDDIVYLARSVNSRIISVNLNVGRRIPAHCTSIGYVLLAHTSAERLDSYLATVKLQHYTEQSVVSPQKLRATLAATRDDGFAVVDQLWEPGVRSIAVPVRNQAGDVVAGINVIVPAARVPLSQMKSRFLKPLQEAARDLGAQLVS